MADGIAGEISAEEAFLQGIVARHSVMENGEARYRLLSEVDHSAYVRTESNDARGWQRAHLHESVVETYILQRGRILFAEWVNERLDLTEYKAGSVFSTHPGIPHNLYIYPNTVLHTVKHGGEAKPEDWQACEALDERVQCIEIPG